jgi:hypothetical protein
VSQKDYRGVLLLSKLVIGISLLKGKCNRKEREKSFSQIIVWQKKGTFFCQEVLHKCAKSNAKRKDRKRVDYAN